MALTRTGWIWTLSAVIGVGAVGTAGAAWAITASHDSTADGGQQAGGTPSRADATPGEIPALYAGDELSWFLLSDDQLASLLHVSDVQPMNANYRTVGEREGVMAEPVMCDDVAFDLDGGGMIGVRAKAWGQRPLDGAIVARQFPDEAQAKEWAAGLMDIFPTCSSFQIARLGESLSSESLSDPVEASNAEARAVSFDQSSSHGVFASNTFHAVMLHGNVVMTIKLPHSEAVDIDQKALVEAMITQATAAHEQLRKELG